MELVEQILFLELDFLLLEEWVEHLRILQQLIVVLVEEWVDLVI